MLLIYDYHNNKIDIWYDSDLDLKKMLVPSDSPPASAAAIFAPSLWQIRVIMSKTKTKTKL